MSAIHNPDNLTQSQLGEGFRFRLTSEVDGTAQPNCERWNPLRKQWEPAVGWGFLNTYRVPAGTPVVPALSWNDPKYFPVTCPKCHWKGMSNEAAGGEQTPGGDDHDDIVCPVCIHCDKEGKWQGPRIVLEDLKEPEPDGTPVAGVGKGVPAEDQEFMCLVGFIELAKGMGAPPLAVDAAGDSLCAIYKRVEHLEDESRNVPLCGDHAAVWFTERRFKPGDCWFCDADKVIAKLKGEQEQQPPPAPDARAEFEAWWASDDFIKAFAGDDVAEGTKAGLFLAWQAATARAEGKGKRFNIPDWILNLASDFPSCEISEEGAIVTSDELIKFTSELIRKLADSRDALARRVQSLEGALEEINNHSRDDTSPEVFWWSVKRIIESTKAPQALNPEKK